MTHYTPVQKPQSVGLGGVGTRSDLFDESAHALEKKLLVCGGATAVVSPRESGRCTMEMAPAPRHTGSAAGVGEMLVEQRENLAETLLDPLVMLVLVEIGIIVMLNDGAQVPQLSNAFFVLREGDRRVCLSEMAGAHCLAVQAFSWTAFGRVPQTVRTAMESQMAEQQLAVGLVVGLSVAVRATRQIRGHAETTADADGGVPEAVGTASRGDRGRGAVRTYASCTPGLSASQTAHEEVSSLGRDSEAPGTPFSTLSLPDEEHSLCLGHAL